MPTVPHATPELARTAVDTIKMLAVDAVEAANSGHPGLPMGAADHAFVLWTEFLRCDPSDPAWPDRDRFVLSAGHGSMLQYALLHLSGYDVSLDDLRAFRQLHSKTPGHPEFGHTPGVETTTGPLGQGFANGVGMALAAQRLAAEVNTDDFAPVAHRVFGIVSDGDLMEGVAAEAASMAGHLRLGNLIYVYDDNRITIEGETCLTYDEDTPKRFESYGWHVQSIDGHDHDAIRGALAAAVAETGRPSLIAARTHIGRGSPGKEDSEDSHGAPLGADEVAATKANIGWPAEPTFHVPDEVAAWFAQWRQARVEHAAEWRSRFDAWADANPEPANQWRTAHERHVPDDIVARLLDAVPDKAAATRKLSGAVLQTAAEIVPTLIGGSADLGPSNNTMLKSYTSLNRGHLTGRNIHFGVREHAMGAVMNGMALHGTAIPYGGTFLIFSDYMRPAIRLASLMKQQAIYVFTHDSIFLGEDGPTHQPVEQLSALRAIPGLDVIRPADPAEVAVAWGMALARRDGPTALVLTRQGVPVIEREIAFDPEGVERGGYAVNDVASPDAVVIATGSELHVALEAAGRVAADTGKAIRVVSMPCVDRFREQTDAVQNEIVPEGVPVAVVEAGSAHGWGELLGRRGLMIGVGRFGASAPYGDLATFFGLDVDSVTARLRTWIA